MEQVCQIAILLNENTSCVLVPFKSDWLKSISTGANINLENKMYLSA